MPTYFRAISVHEEEAIRRTNVIPANYRPWNNQVEGGRYEPCTVVFLFLEKAWPKYVMQCVQRFREIGFEYNYVIRFDLEAHLPVDESGWGAFGAVVHDGPIPLATVDKFEWIPV